MKVLFHLGHPAHYHLFKHTMKALEKKGNQIYILIKKKDILEDLLQRDGFHYRNILPKGRRDSKAGIAIGQLKQDIRLLFFVLRKRPDLMAGTSVAIAHVGKLMGIPNLNVNEDDAEAVPLYAKLSYPWSTYIISPSVCSTGKWKDKKIAYEGYHELAYLHPDHFIPDKNIAQKYLDLDKPYFIIRFAKLKAHHDSGIKGIHKELALKIIELLKPHGNIFITSEIELDPVFESYRIKINPVDIHHVMAFASLYIGDSQTMAAEAGVLGTPFIRFNDFVDRISYLAELENKYELGYGIRPEYPEKLLDKVSELMSLDNLNDIFRERRNKMLADKINLADYLTNLIERYPESIPELKK